MINRYCTVALATLTITLGVTTQAFAGKPERDKVDELKPTATEAVDAIKTACGCDVAINVKWDSYTDVNKMGGISGAISTLKSTMLTHCEKPADKKAICDNVTEAEITFSDAADVKYAPKKLLITAGESYMGDGVYNQILDKF